MPEREAGKNVKKRKKENGMDVRGYYLLFS